MSAGMQDKAGLSTFIVESIKADFAASVRLFFAPMAAVAIALRQSFTLSINDLMATHRAVNALFPDKGGRINIEQHEP